MVRSQLTVTVNMPQSLDVGTPAGQLLAWVFPPCTFWGCGWSIPEPSLVQWLSAGARLQMWNWVIKRLRGAKIREKHVRFPGPAQLLAHVPVDLCQRRHLEKR